MIINIESLNHVSPIKSIGDGNHRPFICSRYRSRHISSASSPSSDRGGSVLSELNEIILSIESRHGCPGALNLHPTSESKFTIGDQAIELQRSRDVGISSIEQNRLTRIFKDRSLDLLFRSNAVVGSVIGSGVIRNGAASDIVIKTPKCNRRKPGDELLIAGRWRTVCNHGRS